MGKLFGSSGVRGLVNTFLTPQLAYKVGLSVATFSKAKRAVVGRDTRTSGQMLENALVSGLMAAGVDVSLVGVVPTPCVAYLTRELGADVGFMLTASHNPPQYNGIKVFHKDSLSLSDADQTEVEGIIAKDDFRFSTWRQMGRILGTEVSARYFEMLKKAATVVKKWNIVLDPGCGATYDVAPSALIALGCRITALNAQPDGHFPARSSEPSPASLNVLAKCVKASGADLGIGFDGDGDRVAFIDDNGKFADFDRALAAYSAYLLKKRGGGVIVTNVEASMCVETMAAKFGGKVYRSKVGDVYVAEAMKQFNAIFGGEPCGAWVHPHIHWCPDGPLSAVLLLSALEEENMNLREFIDQVPQYVTLRENIACKNEQKQKVVSELEKIMKNRFKGFTDFSKVDGVRLSLKNGWVLARASGTEPLIRLTVEGESLKAAQDIMNKGTSILQEILGEV